MDIYPAAAQRQALLTLMPALGCSDTALRRDECGYPAAAQRQALLTLMGSFWNLPERAR